MNPAMDAAMKRRLAAAAAIVIGLCTLQDAYAAPVFTAELVLAPASLATERIGATAQGVFHLRRCTLHVERGAVLLSAEHGAAMRTDDAVRIEVERMDGRRGVWTHDFRDVDTGGITAVSAQRLDELFGDGVHIVTITLIDLRPPVRSSSGYVLRYRAQRDAPPASCIDGEEIARRDALLLAPVSTSAAAAAAPDAPDDALRWAAPPAGDVSSIRPVLPTVEQRIAPRADERATVVAEYGERSRRQAAVDDVVQEFVHEEAPVIGLTALTALNENLVGRISLLLAAAVIAVLALLTYAARRATPCMSGLLSVQDMQTGERLDHIELVQYGASAWIQRAPLRLHAGAAPQEAAAALAADLDGGCVFRSDLSGRRVLHDGDVVVIGEQVRMHYRAPATVYTRSGEAAS